MIDTYQMVKRSQVGTTFREGGEPVPEAHLWHVTPTLVSASVIKKVQLSEEDFAAAVDQYCSDEDAEKIYEALGLQKIDTEGPKHKGRATKKGTVLASSAPTEIQPDDAG